MKINRIIQNFQNDGKFSAFANSRYQALFSDFSNRPGDEAMHTPGHMITQSKRHCQHKLMVSIFVKF